jgi:demethylmenaquinone methyltransferase / 2-methoxy-6-polyprenyl-1,4-benzoquinol methylase
VSTTSDRPTTPPGSSPRGEHALRLFAGLGPGYERMGALLSFGQDPRWRRFLVSCLPTGAGTVLDVATGTGLVARRILDEGRARLVVALDRSEPMLREARSRSDARLLLARAEDLPFPDATFDALTVTYLLRYVDDPAATLREFARVVKPGGVVASLEFGVPTNPLWYACWWAYTRLAMPLIGRAVSPDWYEVGRFLGPSVEAFWRRFPAVAQHQLWAQAGFSPMRARRMSLGGGVVTWAVREP